MSPRKGRSVSRSAQTSSTSCTSGLARSRVRPEEDRVAGRDAVVVLSHDTWTEQFGSDPAIVGREIRLTGARHVIGVAPQAFTGIDIYLRPAFYVPLRCCR